MSSMCIGHVSVHFRHCVWPAAGWKLTVSANARHLKTGRCYSYYYNRHLGGRMDGAFILSY